MDHTTTPYGFLPERSGPAPCPVWHFHRECLGLEEPLLVSIWGRRCLLLSNLFSHTFILEDFSEYDLLLCFRKKERKGGGDLGDPTLGFYFYFFFFSIRKKKRTGRRNMLKIKLFQGRIISTYICTHRKAKPSYLGHFCIALQITKMMLVTERISWSLVFCFVFCNTGITMFILNCQWKSWWRGLKQK